MPMPTMPTIHLDYNVVGRPNNLQDTAKLPCETKIDTTQSNSPRYDERTRNKRYELTTASGLVNKSLNTCVSLLRKTTEPSWSYVIEKLERWNGLVIKDLC